MNDEEFAYEEVDEWEDKYQISYTTGKPSPMKTKRKKALAPWQRIEQLKDETMLKKQLLQDDYSFYD